MKQEFMKKVESAGIDAVLISRVYDFAKNAHEGQKRVGGEDFFSHPLSVAEILLEHKQNLPCDTAIIAAALLHDTVEDTKAHLEDINENFNGEITGLVSALTKIEHSEDVQINHELTYKKVLQEGKNDKRVFLVKLADLVHNLRTLDALPSDRRRRIAKEALDFYLPIAKDLELDFFEKEIEFLAKKHI